MAGLWTKVPDKFCLPVILNGPVHKGPKINFFYKSTAFQEDKHPFHRNYGTNWGNCEEELPKKPVGRLSVNCRPTHYRQFTDRLPTANRQATDSFPKKKIVEKTRIKHDIETIIISIDITYLPIDGKTISSDMFIERF